MRSRCVERTVAVSPLTNLTSAQMWPFVWRQCRNTTPRAPDRLARTCMSRRRSMPIFFLLARCYCVGVTRLSASSAAFGAELSTDSAALRSGFGFGSAVPRQTTSVPEAAAQTFERVLETSRACLVGSIAALLTPVLPLLFAPHARRPRTESRLDPCADLYDVCTGTEKGCFGAASIGRSCGAQLFAASKVGRRSRFTGRSQD